MFCGAGRAPLLAEPGDGVRPFRFARATKPTLEPGRATASAVAIDCPLPTHSRAPSTPTPPVRARTASVARRHGGGRRGRLARRTRRSSETSWPDGLDAIRRGTDATAVPTCLRLFPAGESLPGAQKLTRSHAGSFP